MHRFLVEALIVTILVVNLSFGAGTAIGVVTEGGSFTIDNARAAGHATLFEGNTIETGKDASRFQLNSGARMQLAAESRGIVYRDRLVLERGASQVEGLGGFELEALSLRIRPESGPGPAQMSSAQVSIMGSNLIRVAAMNGPVRVTKANGILVARLNAGLALNFQPEVAGAAAPSTLTGCLVSDGGKLLLKDEISAVPFWVTGTDLEKEVGHRVQVTGTVNPSSPEANQVRVSSVRVLAKKCSAKAGAAATGAAGAAGAGGAGAAGNTGAAVGMAVATKAIIAGVIIAGASTGAVVAAVRSSGSGDAVPISPSSR